MRRISDSQTVISKCAEFVGVGSDRDVAVIEIVVIGIPISAKKLECSSEGSREALTSYRSRSRASISGLWRRRRFALRWAHRIGR